MGKLTILSPVHIGNGNTYPNYIIFGTKKYSFDKLLNIAIEKNKDQLLSDNFIYKLINPERNAGQTKEEIAKVLKVEKSELENITEEYEVNIKTPRFNQFDINEQIKDLQSVLIPGSTLKGYITNVIMFDIIKNNRKIHDFYRANLSNSRYINNFEREVFTLSNQSLICRDLKFPKKIDIKLVSRISKRGPIPSIYECIPNNSVVDTEIINVVKKDLIHKLDNPNSKLLYSEILKRILNIKSEFASMNKEYMLNAIKYERDFVDNTKVRNIDKFAINKQLDHYVELLNSGRIIIQLGKNTNYIVKSVGHAYNKKFYEEQFYRFFNPGRRPRDKKTPVAKPFLIGSMNLVSDFNYELYNEIPGFVEIVW